MINMTNSKKCAAPSVDTDVYLAWADTKWTIVGDVFRVYNETKKNLCKHSDRTAFILLTGKICQFMIL